MQEKILLRQIYKIKTKIFSKVDEGRFFMYGVVLIGVMVITGGAIAFIGDKLGTKIGKKRLSIFGLRPRHTSMIITVITGILITGLSIGAMAIVSKDVRTALFGMEELNAAIASTRSALETTTKDLSTMQEEYKRAEIYAGKTCRK